MVEDQKLVAIREVYRLRTAGDVGGLIACPLPKPFHTGDLADSLSVERWFAQRIAYCLRKVGILREVGKQGNARLYEFLCRAEAEKAAQAGKISSGLRQVPMVSVQ